MTRSEINKTIDAIAGSNGGRRYSGGKSGQSDLADEIENMARTIHMDGLDENQADHLERVLASFMAVIRKHMREQQGVKLRAWRFKHGDPSGTDKHGMTWEAMGWKDHAKKLVFPSGQTQFIGEPYRLDGDDLRGLVALLDGGWHVIIEPTFSTHFPGSTMLVRVSKPSEKDPRAEAQAAADKLNRENEQ